jgi:hypothetical protein
MRQQKVLLAIKIDCSPTVVLNPIIVHLLVSDVIDSVRTNARARSLPRLLESRFECH